MTYNLDGIPPENLPKANEYLAKIEKLKQPENPLFYPEVGDDYFEVDGDAMGGYLVEKYERFKTEAPYKHPVIRTQHQAELIAKGRAELDRWRAMGTVPQDGVELWTMDDVGDARASGHRSVHRVWDALFYSRDEAIAALKEFGGIEKLKEARAWAWGQEYV